jgi:hypothetical protein
MARGGVEPRCSFCGKHRDKVRQIIAGPGGVFICAECVELCSEIVGEARPPGGGPANATADYRAAWRSSRKGWLRRLLRVHVRQFRLG